jgi:hypothetical protein
MNEWQVAADEMRDERKRSTKNVWQKIEGRDESGGSF